MLVKNTLVFDVLNIEGLDLLKPPPSPSGLDGTYLSSVTLHDILLDGRERDELLLIDTSSR